MSRPSTTYNLGDYIYCEISPTEPYKIRRIEELVKNPEGVEAEVTCFYRRRDIPARLLSAFDELQEVEGTFTSETESSGLDCSSALELPLGFTSSLSAPLSESQEQDSNDEGLQKADTAENDESAVLIGQTPVEEGFTLLPGHQKHSLKDRELFISGQIELVSESDIRGKCTVALLKEGESCSECLNDADTFYYSWAFDPVRQTLKKVEEKKIRIGDEFQCKVPDATIPEISNSEDFETIVWSPYNEIPDHQVDQFLVLARSVGTYARAIDCLRPGTEKSLTMNAAAASRDATLQNALNILHKNKYDMSAAWGALVPSCEPVLCRDEFEGWCSAEAALFEEGMLKHGKDFFEIRQDFLPWKSVKNIVEYYYMWKTSDRYVKQKKGNVGQAESKLIQVLISSRYDVAKGCPASNLQNTANSCDRKADKSCSMCGTSVSSGWLALDNANTGCQLCCNCQDYWKRYGGKLKSSQVDQAAESNNGEEDYRCFECKRSFNRAVKLAAHVKSHKAAPKTIPKVLDLSRDAVPTRWREVKVVLRKLSSEQIERLINRKWKNLDTVLDIYKGKKRRRRCQVDYVPGMNRKRTQKRCRTKSTARQTGELEHTFEETLHRDISAREGWTLKNNNTKNVNLNLTRMREASVVLRRLPAEEIAILTQKKSKHHDTNLKIHRGRRSEGTHGEFNEGIFLERKQRRRIPLTAYQTNKLELAFKPTQNPDIYKREGVSQRIKLTKKCLSNHRVALTNQLSPASPAKCTFRSRTIKEPSSMPSTGYHPAIGLPSTRATAHANFRSSRRHLQHPNQGFSSVGLSEGCQTLGTYSGSFSPAGHCK